jgi:DNA mismatch repair protein MutL
LLIRMGFDIEEFGENTIRVKSIPALFSNADPLSLIKTCIEDFEEDENPLGNELEKKIIARICKRSAVKSGQLLSHEEQLKLVADLEHCETPRSCPHGRPTMIHLSVDLLERQFGRRGSR